MRSSHKKGEPLPVLGVRRRPVFSYFRSRFRFSCMGGGAFREADGGT